MSPSPTFHILRSYILGLLVWSRLLRRTSVVVARARLQSSTREFVFACATDPILARLLFIASLMVYLITRMDAFFVVPEVIL